MSFDIIALLVKVIGGTAFLLFLFWFLGKAQLWAFKQKVNIEEQKARLKYGNFGRS